jgi:hypothetical protein
MEEIEVEAARVCSVEAATKAQLDLSAKMRQRS